MYLWYNGVGDAMNKEISDINKRMEYETNHKIPFVYITFSTVKDWFVDTKIYFDKQNQMNNTAFVFLDDRRLDKEIISYIDECYNFGEFLFDLLKGVGV